MKRFVRFLPAGVASRGGFQAGKQNNSRAGCKNTVFEWPFDVHCAGKPDAVAMDTVHQNKEKYGRSDVAATYALQSHLQPPEETILRLMLPVLGKARLLDLGVGGGRTTLDFAKWAREYVGADYAESMIQECQRRFSGYPEHISFRVCDARHMGMFADSEFEIVLFSHNGIDYVEHEDRLRILREIWRVAKPEAHFCFSTHNLNWCANLFELRRIISLNPGKIIRGAEASGSEDLSTTLGLRVPW